MQSIIEDRGGRYVSLDDDDARLFATTDPQGFVDALPFNSAIDEIQRAPNLLLAIKRSVDKQRVPGRFLLTGSTNVLALPKLSDALAGRMSILRLFPFAQTEIGGRGKTSVVDELFNESVIQREYRLIGDELAPMFIQGGYPAAVAAQNPRVLRRWYRDYFQTVTSREVRYILQLGDSERLNDILRLMFGETSHLLNIQKLASALGFSRTSIETYIAASERLFLVDKIPAYHPRSYQRHIRSPRHHACDTGLALALESYDDTTLRQHREVMGQMLETMVVTELLKHASWAANETTCEHYRDRDGYKVDVVLRQGSRVVGIEVKLSQSVSSTDVRGLKRLRTVAGDDFQAGYILYDGRYRIQLDDSIHALPLSAILT